MFSKDDIVESFRRGINTLGDTLDVWQAGHAASEAIKNRQQTRLMNLVKFARKNSDFYQRLYKDLPEIIEDISLLPPVNKLDLKFHFNNVVTDPEVNIQAVEDFVDNPFKIGERFLGKYFVCTTSGTTGEPGIFLHDEGALRIYSALRLARMINWVNPQWIGDFISKKGRIAAIVAAERHFATVGAVEHIKKRYPRILGSTSKIFSVAEPVANIVNELNDFQPAVLFGYPTAIEVLARQQEEGRLKITPKLVLTAGEMLTSSARVDINKSFDCLIRDIYGASEFIHIAYDCGQSLHLNNDWVILEPVDENLKAVPPGSLSHTALITNLANRVLPIIREDLGDSIKVKTENCPCGSFLPAIEVLGRTDEILKLQVSDGTFVPIVPQAIIMSVEQTPGLQMFQIIQTGSALLEVRIETEREADGNIVWDKMSQSLRSCLARQGVTNINLERSEVSPKRDEKTGKFCHICSKIKNP